jgi:hypothetical protein
VTTPTPEAKGILELLGFEYALKTPSFQRSYAWARHQIDDYWNDLKRALDNSGGTAPYFLGLMVFDDAEEIQDGQQRLATTLLLAAEMYTLIEAAKVSGQHDAQLAIDAAAQISSALRQSPSTPLVIQPSDQDVLLNRAGVSSDLPESARRLRAARQRLRKHLSDDLANRSTPDAQLARLKQWGEFLRHDAYAVLLRVPPKDAHNIFETLNTRGVRLSNGDLVKSHLIGGASATNVAVSKWNSITEALKDPKGNYEDDLESFLPHYYGSRYGKTTGAEFFNDYRAAIENVDPLVALDELLQSARLYRALADPASQAAFWSSEVGTGAQQAVELLNGLALKQLRFLLLAVLRDLGAGQADATRKAKKRDAVVKITAWSVRGLVHGQTGGGHAESTYIRAAVAIHQGGITTVDQLKQHFVSRGMLTESNSLFKTRFKEYPWDRRTAHTRARAILYALDYYKITTKSGLKPRDTLTVEHVLPQNPAAGQWSQFTEVERRAYTYNLGNLLLIDGPSGANDDLRNREWPAKKTLIKSWPNQTPLTTEALKRQQWTKSTIDGRNDSLAALAVKAFAT